MINAARIAIRRDAHFGKIKKVSYEHGYHGYDVCREFNQNRESLKKVG